jgi:hypothetical protein
MAREGYAEAKASWMDMRAREVLNGERRRRAWMV